MNQSYKEYGRALFMLALENGKTDEYSAELQFVSDVFEENPDIYDILTSPAVYLSERLEIINKVFADNVSEHICSFLKILCEKKNILSLKDCINEYNKLVENLKDISFARIISAIELSEDDKSRIVSGLENRTGKKITAKFVTDPSIYGGIIVETDGKIFDASLRYKLKDVKEVMSR